MLSVVESLATVIKDPVHQVGLVPVRWQAILICGDMGWVVGGGWWVVDGGW